MRVNYRGSEELLTSVAGENIIPEGEENWTYSPIRFKDFAFMNTTDCTVKVNEGKPIFLKANQGFQYMGNDKNYIDSFIIVESGIEYQFIGRY